VATAVLARVFSRDRKGPPTSGQGPGRTPADDPRFAPTRSTAEAA